ALRENLQSPGSRQRWFFRSVAGPATRGKQATVAPLFRVFLPPPSTTEDHGKVYPSRRRVQRRQSDTDPRWHDARLSAFQCRLSRDEGRDILDIAQRSPRPAHFAHRYPESCVLFDRCLAELFRLPPLPPRRPASLRSDAHPAGQTADQYSLQPEIREANDGK